MLGKKKEKKQREPDAIITGTVYDESGRLIREATVTAHNEAAPKKKFSDQTNYRGEYRIHVPAREATFVLTATARKFQKAERTVKIYGIDQVTANLMLKPKK